MRQTISFQTTNFSGAIMAGKTTRRAFVGSSVVNQALVGQPDQALVTVSEIIDYNCVMRKRGH
jgi:hypothetical protein